MLIFTVGTTVLLGFVLQKPAFAVQSDVGPDGGYVRNEHNSRVVVFVHGLFSDPETWRCDGNHYWPKMIAEDNDQAFAKTDIYALSYTTPKTGGSMSMTDLQTQMFARLEADRVFSGHRDVIFVSHSLGGILTQQLLLKYRNEQLWKKVRFIYLYGTPQEGSKVASLYKHLNSDPLLKELASGDQNFILHDLDQAWVHAGFAGIHRYCAYETKKERGFRVVDRYSATRGCEDTTALNADHSHIVKPCSTSDDSYLALKSKLVALQTNSTFGEDISIEPSVSLDSREAFQQQFTILNTGNIEIREVRYACAITSMTLVPPKISSLDNLTSTLGDYSFTEVYSPMMSPITKLYPKEKTTADCDYLVRYGNDLMAANIEIEVMYKTSEDGDYLVARQGFAGRRDSEEKFRWTYGSPDESPLQPAETRSRRCMVAYMAFGGSNRHLAPPFTADSLINGAESWAKLYKGVGCKTILATTPAGNYD